MRQNPSLKDQLTAAERLLLCCTTPEISREADCELLFLAVGEFRDVSLFRAPALMSDPLFALSLPWWELWLEVLGALVPQVSVGVAKQHVTSLFLLMAGAK